MTSTVSFFLIGLAFGVAFGAAGTLVMLLRKIHED